MSLFTNKYLLIAFVVVGAVAYVTAYKEFAVTQVADQTICPITVEDNDDPERTPRNIKFLKCAEQPNSICTEPSHNCCERHTDGYRAECVEIYDFMEVSYKSDSEPTTIRVPVGCNCLLAEITKAEEVHR